MEEGRWGVDCSVGRLVGGTAPIHDVGYRNSRSDCDCGAFGKSIKALQLSSLSESGLRNVMVVNAAGGVGLMNIGHSGLNCATSRQFANV